MVILVPPDQHISDAWAVTEPWLGVLMISSVSMAWTLVGNGDSWTPVQTYVVRMQFRFEKHWSGTDRPFWKVISQTSLLINESGAVLRIPANSTFQNLTGGEQGEQGAMSTSKVKLVLLSRREVKFSSSYTHRIRINMQLQRHFGILQRLLFSIRGRDQEAAASVLLEVVLLQRRGEESPGVPKQPAKSPWESRVLNI